MLLSDGAWVQDECIDPTYIGDKPLDNVVSYPLWVSLNGTDPIELMPHPAGTYRVNVVEYRGQNTPALSRHIGTVQFTITP